MSSRQVQILPDYQKIMMVLIWFMEGKEKGHSHTTSEPVIKLALFLKKQKRTE